MNTNQSGQWKTIEYTPKLASEDLLRKHWELQVAIEKEFQPDDPVPPFEAFKDSMIVETPLWDWRPYVVFDQEKIIGSAELGYTGKDSPDYKENKHIGEISITVHRDWRRRGVGTSLLKHVLKDALELSITTIEGGSRRESGISFCRELGGVECSTSSISKLYLKDVDWSMIKSWITKGQLGNPDTSIEIAERVPEQCFKELAVLEQTLLIEAHAFTNSGYKVSLKNAEEDLRNFIKYQNDVGAKLTFAMMQKQDVGMIGMTEIFFNPKKPYVIEQGMTGVLKEYRCKGLGRWLKAEMLLYVGKHFKDALFVRTGNSNSNDAMLKINSEMGFKADPTYYYFKFDALELAKKLGMVNE